MNYTPKQLQIMSFIQDYRRTKGTAPTLEEIGQSLGIHRVTVHQHVGALVKKGAVQKLAQRCSDGRVWNHKIRETAVSQN